MSRVLHVVCRGCTFEGLHTTAVAAESAADDHRGQTDHRVAVAQVSA